MSALLVNVAALLPGEAQVWALSVLEKSILINLILAVFNMLPIPPLDGGRIAVGLLPRNLAMPLARVAPYGFFIVLGLIFLLPIIGQNLGVDLNFVWHFVVFVVFMLMHVIVTVFA